MREYLKDEALVKKQIAEVVFKALTSNMTGDELSDEIWEILENAEKVMR